MSEATAAPNSETVARHRPYRVLVALLCGIIFLSDPAVYGMYQATEQIVTKWYYRHERLERRIFKPNVGLPEISSPAFHLIGMVRKAKLTEFSISQGLRSDPLALQRITEGAWPAKIESSSKNLFLLPHEQPPGDCIVQSFTVAVMYVTCK